MKPKETWRRVLGLYAAEIPRGQGHVAHLVYEVEYSDMTRRTERGPDIYSIEAADTGLLDALRVAALAHELLIARMSERDEKMRSRRRKRR